MIVTSNPIIDAKMLRKQAGLTLKQVSEQLKVHITTVHRWETGESPPMIPLEKVAVLVRIYNCSIDELASAYSAARQDWLEKQSTDRKVS